MRGTVDIGGVPYTAVIADRGETDNKVDFEHDGLYLKKKVPGAYERGDLIRTIKDLENVRNGKSDIIYVSDEEARSGVEIGGKRYVFDIAYKRVR